jgi:hypothetical protein
MASESSVCLHVPLGPVVRGDADDVHLDPVRERRQLAEPTAVWFVLPGVPERVVSGRTEHLEPPVLVLSDGESPHLSAALKNSVHPVQPSLAEICVSCQTESSAAIPITSRRPS